MIIEIKGFTIPTSKICSISPVKIDKKNRFCFIVELDNANFHQLVYASEKAANVARDIAAKALEGETVDITDILKKVDAKANTDIAQKAINELLKELGVKDVVELKKLIK